MRNGNCNKICFRDYLHARTFEEWERDFRLYVLIMTALMILPSAATLLIGYVTEVLTRMGWFI